MSRLAKAGVGWGVGWGGWGVILFWEESFCPGNSLRKGCVIVYPMTPGEGPPLNWGLPGPFSTVN